VGAVAESADALAVDLLFYRTDGIGAVAHIQDGQFHQTQSIDTFAPNWSQIVAVGDQLLFYRTDGIGAVAHIQDGHFHQTQSIDTFAPNWSRIVAVGE
jgi:hypothetical protein